MDYDLLTRFRNAVAALSKCPCDTDHTTKHISAIRATAHSLRGPDLVHELHHVDSLVARFRIVRHLPVSCRPHILQSAVLAAPSSSLSSSTARRGTSVKKKPLTKSNTVKILAAQLTSLTLDWGCCDPDSRDDATINNETTTTTSSLSDDPLLHALQVDYSKLFNTIATQAEQILVRQLNDYIRAATLSLSEARQTVHLIAVDESLDGVDETVRAQWATVRSSVVKLCPLLATASNLYLDIEVAQAETLLHQCSLFHRSLRSRGVDVPDVTTRLGTGTTTITNSVGRSAASISAAQQQSHDDDNDDDEWEEPVYVAPETNDNDWDDIREEEEEDDYDDEKDEDEYKIRKVGSHVLPRSQTQQSRTVVQQQAENTLSRLANNGFAGLRRDAKASSSHNNAVLDAIQPVMPGMEGTPQKRSKDGKKKKQAVQSVHDRLRTKLGIKKAKKRPPRSP